MHEKASKRSRGFRLVLAALIATSGSLLVSPSFNFDTDRDGVADASEVYERGTDPAKPDPSFNRTLVQRSDKG